MATPAPNPLTAGPSAADVQRLDTAILLTAVSVGMEDEAAQPVTAQPVGPLTPVAGVPLFLRTVLTLQRSGITNLIILTGAEEEPLKRLAQDRRVTAVVRWMPVREFPLGNPRTWEVLTQDVRGNCLVIGGHTLFSPALIEYLKERAHTNSGRRVLVPVSSANQVAEGEAADILMVVPASLLRAQIGPSLSVRPDKPLEAMKSRMLSDGRLEPVPMNPGSFQWCLAVRTPAAVQEAERRFLHLPKGSYDGFIDTYFNRKVANGLTRLFLKAGWSPNAITMLSLLVGFLAAGLFAQGTYLAGVAGALVFQLSAIIDCCDGDVARVTFRESRFGAQLDLIGDNVVHMAMFAAMAWAGYLHGGGGIALSLGLFAIVGNGMSLWMVTRAKVRGDRHAWADPVQAARSEFIIKNMASRDFSIVVLFFALLNLLDVFLWLAAIGSNAFWIITAWITRSPALRA